MELLSPAANIETALAAFDGGADAVYCGLGKFNARERAENFNPETMGRLIRFAHANGKKVYVTLNTLIKERECGELFTMLCDLVKLSPDALIVQDPGVVEIARNYFPELTLHASTQMGIHNSAGVAAAAALGIKRVILERQVTLEELKSISAKSAVELEVFIHGSLCCSLSGRCLLSAHLNGCSGNRGTCRQPCRKHYFSRTANGYLLSPKDLCGTGLIDELHRMGIASLKIEGRLRSPDYVWKTARAYRILLDNGSDRAAAEEAATLLDSASSRERSIGFYNLKRDRNTLIDAGRSGSFGKCVATVEKVLRGGLVVKCNDVMHLGDRLRLVPQYGGDGESFSLIKLERRKGEKILRSRAGERCFIPGSFNAGENWSINKIGENGFDFSRRAASLPEYNLPLDVKIRCSAGKWEAEFTDRLSSLPRWECSCDFAAADKHPLTEAEVKKVFSAGAPEKWFLRDINVEIEGNFFVPLAELKKLRRSFWDHFAEQLDAEQYFADIPLRMEKFFTESQSFSGRGVCEVDLKKFFTILPFVPEGDLEKTAKRIAGAYRSGVRDFAVTGLHGFELLKNFEDVRIITLFPFPVTNSRAAAVAKEANCVMCESAWELNDDENRELAERSPLPLFRRERKDIPLLVTRLPLPEGEWQDKAGNSFSVRISDGISELFPSGK